MTDTIKVTIAHPYTDKAGKSHTPGSPADLPEDEARKVIADGYARPADSTADKAPTKDK